MARVFAEVYIGYDFSEQSVYEQLDEEQRRRVEMTFDARVLRWFMPSLPTWESVDLGEPIQGRVPEETVRRILDRLLDRHNVGAQARNEPTFTLDTRRGNGLFSVHRRFRNGLRRYGLRLDEGGGPTHWRLQVPIGQRLVVTDPFIAAHWEIDWPESANRPAPTNANG